MDKNYITSQIDVYKNQDRLLEFLDKLQPAPIQYYGHIHADNHTDAGGFRRISCIGLHAKLGKEDSAVDVDANILPFEADLLYRKALICPKAFEFKSIKKYDSPLTKATYEKPLGGGNVKGANLIITRKSTDHHGAPLNNPWTVTIENFLYKGGKRSVTVWLSDRDFTRCLYSVTHFVQMWEVAKGWKLYVAGQHELQERLKAAAMMDEFSA